MPHLSFNAYVCKMRFSQRLHTGFRMASIKPHPAGGFRAFICVAGRRESKVFQAKREAQQWAAARELALTEDASKPAAVKFTLSDALDKYREEVSPGKRGARWEAVRISAFLTMPDLPTRLPIGSVTTDAMAQWRDARLKQVTPGTVLREISLLSAVFDVARREWKWITENPIKDMRRPRQPDHREVIISRAQVVVMLRALGHQRGPCKRSSQSVARAFILALRTGMRAGEISGLTWDRVFDDYCSLPITKTRPRNVPIEPRARRLIESMRGWDNKTVFGLTAQTLDALFRKARKNAGLNGFTFHDARHTAATRLARRLDVLTLCKMFGWSNPAMAMTYYNPTASDIAKRLAG